MRESRRLPFLQREDPDSAMSQGLFVFTEIFKTKSDLFLAFTVTVNALFLGCSGEPHF